MSSLLLDSNGFPRGRLLDMRSRRMAVPSEAEGMLTEWDCTIVDLTVVVTPADIPWSTRIISATLYTPPGTSTPVIQPLVVDFAAVPVDQYRWVYAEINFGSSTITAGLTASGAKALNAPGSLISRRNLRCYKRTSTTAIAQLGPVAWVGEISFGGETPPPQS